MRTVLAPLTLAAVFATSVVAFAAAEHDIGLIKSIDVKASTITLADGKTFVLPKDFKDPGLKAGEKVDVAWEKAGDKMNATTVTVVK